MAPYQHVSLSIVDRVGTLTLNNPPVNALSRALLEELDAILTEISADQTIKALVITGASEKAFAAGADITVFAARDATTEGPRNIQQYIKLGQDVCAKLDIMALPVIAAINGACLGGGLELALACDIRYAADSAKLGTPEINLGIIPGWGGTQRLPRLVGYSQALELILTGNAIPAEQALQIGLVSKVVPAADLLSSAQSLAHTIAGRSRVAAQAALKAVTEGSVLPLIQGLLLERQQFERVINSDDAREGITAFLEKRRPAFNDQ